MNKAVLCLHKQQHGNILARLIRLTKQSPFNWIQHFEEFTVKAVTANLPTNSSIQFEILISDLNYPKLYNPRVLTSAWFNISPETYVLLKEGVNPQELESKFPSVFQTLLGEEVFKESHYAPGLQPLTEIHLDTSYPVGIAPKRS
ncbi:MAG: hypothetical protein U5K54_05340 [Cytophagales bacterium]|nr:hypothetical protein [Cytophagales bacterium]